ncbi:hypothetical protein G5V59_09925 [Nocardioides sp. W3-2-3]|nr:hypothetical protein [Nocardioides convexus]
MTFTASVAVLAPGAGAPSGTITFTDGPTVLGTAPVGSGTGGVASITVDDLGVGQHAVVATYDGDDSFNGSNGSVAQKVQRAQTGTLLTSSVNPSQSGQGVRFTATVSPVAPGAGVAGGTVQFTVNGATLGRLRRPRGRQGDERCVQTRCRRAPTGSPPPTAATPGSSPAPGCSTRATARRSPRARPPSRSTPTTRSPSTARR